MNRLKLNKEILIRGWKTLPWAEIRERVFKLQRIIYEASKVGNIKKVRRFQHLLCNSTAARLLAVRRITQDNTGKVTAGVDGVKRLTPNQRLLMVSILRVPTRAKPVRRVWIPKPGKTEKRPLGIPTIYDRCLQYLFVIFMEPEWEAKFEENSYGFRPGRSCHDAVIAIRSYVQKRAKYVMDADIAKCFDRIDHLALLSKTGLIGKYRKQLKYWLKSGVLDGKTFSESTVGTPQGGAISPLLANIALHGMENVLKEFVKQFKMSYSTGTPIKVSRRAETLGVVRYADDFVILHHDKAVILACYGKVKEFLSGVGLEISPSKTRLTHTLKLEEMDTLDEGFDGVVGFNFLGFTIKQFYSKYRSALSTGSTPLGYKTLVYPSRKAINSYQEKLHQVILVQGKGMSQTDLIKKLNPIIRGWSNYYGAFDANTMNFLTKQDYLMYLKLRKWGRRVFGTTGKARSLFRKIGENKWTFAVSKDLALLNHWRYATPSSRMIKVVGSASPYDSNQKYWTKRLRAKSSLPTRTYFLLNQQKGICTFCKCKFYYNDIMEVDHIIPSHKGGSDLWLNLQLLHRHCHHHKTSLDLIVSKPFLNWSDP